MKRILAAVAVVALMALALPEAASAQSSPNNVALSAQVDWITSSLLVVGVTVRCEGPSAVVDVTVGQGHDASGGGRTQVICDGVYRKYAISVSGCCYRLGAAVASATLIALSGTETDTRNVRIVRP
jgi:hypothetical protein